MATPKKSLVWLASYPKSGNTWLRVFLRNYLFDRQTPMPINDVVRVIETDAAPMRYHAAAQALGLRQTMLRRIVANGADLNMLKTHNFNGKPDGRPLMPPPLTRAAVYVVRNPLDVACSLAQYLEVDLDEVADIMVDRRMVMASKGRLCAQYLCDWSTHVDSWAKAPKFPNCVLRYEDLHADPMRRSPVCSRFWVFRYRPNG